MAVIRKGSTLYLHCYLLGREWSRRAIRKTKGEQFKHLQSYTLLKISLNLLMLQIFQANRSVNRQGQAHKKKNIELYKVRENPPP